MDGLIIWRRVALYLCALSAYATVIFLSEKNFLKAFGRSLKQADRPRPQVKLRRLIQPGNHTNVPAPDSRIGPTGEKGYVHDPTWLKKHPRPLQFDNHSKACVPFQRYPVDNVTAIQLKKIRDYKDAIPRHANTTLFCAVYTYKGGIGKSNAILETWGKRCDGLLLASDHSNITTGHVHLPSNSSNGFHYMGMLQRTRTILAYFYDNFLDDYDFFHLNGDDTYLIVENLKEFCATEGTAWEQASPHNLFFAGYWSSKPWKGNNTHYLGGGSGYTLSRKALQAFVEGPLQTCRPFAEGSAEDVHVSTCFREHLTGNWIDTRDAQGAHRYHQLGLHRHTYWPNRTFGPSTRLMRHSLTYMEQFYGFTKVRGDAYISPSTIAFHQHYSPDELRLQDMLLYDTAKEHCGIESTYSLDNIF